MSNAKKSQNTKYLRKCSTFHKLFYFILFWLFSFPHSSSLKLSSLNESHLELVNRSWKFGCEDSKLMIKNMILHFPSCCVLDSDNQPVAWILTYASCAMGMLYTLPEHRGKGYAKALVTIMSKRLHSQGYPVYCFIEEENHLSYSLFTSLGFTEEPDYRAAWFVFNDF